MTQIRIAGTLPEDDGEHTSHFPRGGSYSHGIADNLVILGQEVMHRWAASVRFVHPTKGIGFDSYDHLGRDILHRSFFMNSAAQPSKFPAAPRFWGPKGNLKVKYFSSTGRVDPAGDASVTLSEADRELGDEADRIDSNGKPVDVKTMAWVLVVKDGAPSAHMTAVGRVDTFRRVWQAYGNGPATGGRGRFDTSLNPAVH